DRFEDRSRLAARVGDAIKLARRVIASTDHRQYLSGVRINGDQSGFRPSAPGSFRAPAEDAVEFRKVIFHRYVRGLLQIGVERRLYFQVRRLALADIPAGQLAPQIIDEVLRG